MSVRLGRFEAELRDGVLSARPDDDFDDEQAARDALEPLLGDWEAIAYLDGNHRISFDFMNADIRDLNPESGSATLRPAAVRASVQIGTDAVIVRHNSA